jgi:hypothetical protein
VSAALVPRDQGFTWHDNRGPGLAGIFIGFDHVKGRSGALRCRDRQSNAEVLAGTNCRWMLCHLVPSWTNEALKLAAPLPGGPWRGLSLRKRKAMSVAKQFQAKGIECFERASRLKDPEYQRVYYDLGVQWLALAAEIDARVSGAVLRYPYSKGTKSF